MSDIGRIPRDSLTNLIVQVDNLNEGETPPDTVPTGFQSVDRAIGGGIRRQDLVMLGGDVGAGKSALAFGIALRAAAAGYKVTYLSGEMNEDRLMERHIASRHSSHIITLASDLQISERILDRLPSFAAEAVESFLDDEGFDLDA